jgi:hypothetical protein
MGKPNLDKLLWKWDDWRIGKERILPVEEHSQSIRHVQRYYPSRSWTRGNHTVME